MTIDQNEIDGELIADIREQVLYMQELGVEALGVDLVSLPDGGISNLRSEIIGLRSDSLERISEISDLKFEMPTIETAPKPQEKRAAGSLLASLPSLTKRQSNTPVSKEEKAKIKQPTEPTAVAVTVELLAVQPDTPTMPEAHETIEQIRAEIGPDCTRCKLSMLGRTHVVNSTGNFNAQLMFVGEAPGADEDEQGLPFVGRAGQLLTDIIEKGLGIPRADVFIGNINRCRPPGNRAPETDETLACKPFLKREIAVVRPKVIVVLGATAAQNLLETKVPIGKLRGHFHDYLGTKVMPTFHPAYLLRDPHKKREVWEDMKLVREMLNISQ